MFLRPGWILIGGLLAGFSSFVLTAYACFTSCPGCCGRGPAITEVKLRLRTGTFWVHPENFCVRCLYVYVN